MEAAEEQASASLNKVLVEVVVLQVTKKGLVDNEEVTSDVLIVVVVIKKGFAVVCATGEE